MTASRLTRDIDRAVAVLASGGIIGLPTETVYGLAARIGDRAAVRRVFDAKSRPRDHPLIVHVSGLDAARVYGRIDERAETLAKAFWPGPLTILVPRTAATPDDVTAGRDTVAIRVPAHPLALEVIDRLGEAIVAPSANRFGKVSPTTASHVLDDLADDVDLVLDGGTCRHGIESTIVDCTGLLQVLRPGAVTAEEIGDVLGEVPGSPTGPSRAPGMMRSHYAPRASVVCVAAPEEAEKTLGRCASEGLTARVIGVGLADEEYAAALYALLRSADSDGMNVVIAVLPAGDGLAEAVRDRLAKASAARPDPGADVSDR